MYKKNHFASDNEVKWCPGCGDHAVLATMQRVLLELSIPRERIVIISGIGCASRFPYYMNTYGFHTIHGRAFPIAYGLSQVRPDLSIWIVTGDGDGLSIGLGHLMHMIRRQSNVNILMFNNRIYGLTKGQYSPTSGYEQISKTSPKGVNEKSLNPTSLAIQTGAGFVARSIDVDASLLKDIIIQASKFKGTAFIEILQNCNVFNDGVYLSFTDKKQRKSNIIYLEDKNPLVFGDNQEKAIYFDNKEMCFKLEKREIIQSFKHDVFYFDRAKIANSPLLQSLAELWVPDHPVLLGIFKQDYKKHNDTKKSTLKKQFNQKLFMNFLKARGFWAISS